MPSIYRTQFINGAHISRIDLIHKATVVAEVGGGRRRAGGGGGGAVIGIEGTADLLQQPTLDQSRSSPNQCRARDH